MVMTSSLCPCWEKIELTSVSSAQETYGTHLHVIETLPCTLNCHSIGETLRCCVCAIKDVTHLLLHINKSYLIFSNDKGAETCYEKNLALTCKIRLLCVLMWLSFQRNLPLFGKRFFQGWCHSASQTRQSYHW